MYRTLLHPRPCIAHSERGVSSVMDTAAKKDRERLRLCISLRGTRTQHIAAARRCPVWQRSGVMRVDAENKGTAACSRDWKCGASFYSRDLQIQLAPLRRGILSLCRTCESADALRPIRGQAEAQSGLSDL